MNIVAVRRLFERRKRVMSQREVTIPTPHQFSWMGPMYHRLISLPEYPNLSLGERAEKLLEFYEEWESDPDMPHREMFSGTREERLEKMNRVIWFFEHEDRRSL
jgi:hypothetical protein